METDVALSLSTVVRSVQHTSQIDTGDVLDDNGVALFQFKCRAPSRTWNVMLALGFQ